MKEFETILDYIVRDQIPVPPTEYFSCMDIYNGCHYGFQRSVDLPEEHPIIDPSRDLKGKRMPFYRLYYENFKLIYGEDHLLHSTTEMANGRYFFIQGHVLNSPKELRENLPRETILKFIDHVFYEEKMKIALL